MLERDGAALKSGAPGYSVLAAPEDGRTPPTSLPPSVTDYPAAQSLEGWGEKVSNIETVEPGKQPEMVTKSALHCRLRSRFYS